MQLVLGFRYVWRGCGVNVVRCRCAVQVKPDGLVDLAELEAAIREDTVVVSVMAVNNEIGARALPPGQCGANQGATPCALIRRAMRFLP